MGATKISFQRGAAKKCAYNLVFKLLKNICTDHPGVVNFSVETQMVMN
jgi:hypothetical protein